jgi:hypothetical protein
MAERSSGTKQAGAFDIRVFIGALLGIYGVILTLTGLFGTSDEGLAKADGVNINLWTGLALLLSSAVFVGWARLRPVVVRPQEPVDGEPRADG